MRKVLFISPHLDDAVFSCAARILRESEAGAQVTVATVFSHARPLSAQCQEYVIRRTEDVDALRWLGGKPLWLGLFDAPCRNLFYDSFRRIVLETAPGDWEQVQVVRKQIACLLVEMVPDALYLPLGVGSHIDHRMVFAAGATLVPNCPLYFYEDQPYAMVRQSVHLRFQEIQAAAMGGNIPLASINLSLEERRLDFLKSFRDAPYVRRYLRSAGERRHCETELCRKLGLALKPHLHLERKTEMANALDQGRIMNALYAYRSQARSFLGDRRRLIQLGRSHARRQGFKGWRAEHVWTLVRRREAKA